MRSAKPEAAYGDAIDAVRFALRHARSAGRLGAPARDRLAEGVNGLLAELKTGDQGLLRLAVRSTAGSYLYAHSVNVAILSMHVASGLRCSDETLKALGRSAISHDLLRLESFTGPVTAEADARLHPLSLKDFFAHVQTIEKVSPEGLVSLGEEKTRADADGSEKRKTAGHGAHVIALCDIYESMTHPRPWREARSPHDALIELLKGHRRESDQRLLKAFTEGLSLFPPGSYVELSNGEIGRVLEIHRETPSSPTVESLIRSDGKANPQRLAVNLAENSHIHIVRAVDEKQMPAKETKLRLELEAGRWWMP